MANSIVQYVIVRGDLLRTMNWPVGAIITQACHACCAVTHLFHDDEHMKTYLHDLDNMHKVVLEVIFNKNKKPTKIITYNTRVPDGLLSMGILRIR